MSEWTDECTGRLYCGGNPAPTERETKTGKLNTQCIQLHALMDKLHTQYIVLPEARSDGKK